MPGLRFGDTEATKADQTLENMGYDLTYHKQNEVETVINLGPCEPGYESSQNGNGGWCRPKASRAKPALIWLALARKLRGAPLHLLAFKPGL